MNHVLGYVLYTHPFILALTLYCHYGEPHFTDEDIKAQERSSDLLR